MITNNGTKVKGVCFESKANKYRAYITVGGEKIKIGYFSTFCEAVEARETYEELKDKSLSEAINAILSKKGKEPNCSNAALQRLFLRYINENVMNSSSEEGTTTTAWASFPVFALQAFLKRNYSDAEGGVGKIVDNDDVYFPFYELFVNQGKSLRFISKNQLVPVYFVKIALIEISDKLNKNVQKYTN